MASNSRKWEELKDDVDDKEVTVTPSSTSKDSDSTFVPET